MELQILPGPLPSLQPYSRTNTKLEQTRATSFIKRWLNVPRCATLASLFHLEVTNLPYLPRTHKKAKLRLLAQVYVSRDARIQDLHSLILNPAFGVREAIPARSSDTMLINHHLLNAPSVQSVLRTSTPPNQAPLRRLQHPPVDRIMFSLPVGQMSFFIRAGIDCLPPPVNLCRWKIHCDPSCPLC